MVVRKPDQQTVAYRLTIFILALMVYFFIGILLTREAALLVGIVLLDLNEKGLLKVILQ